MVTTTLPMEISEIDVKDIVKFKFDLGDDHVGMNIDADLDEKWIAVKWNPEDWWKHSPNYSWTFNLTDELWKRLMDIVGKSKVLGWMKDCAKCNIIDDLPSWDMAVTTHTSDLNWQNSCNYPEGFWGFYSELEQYCDSLYPMIKPDLSMTFAASIYHDFPDSGERSAHITERGLVLQRGISDKEVYLPLPCDRKKLAKYLCNYPLDPSHNGWKPLSKDKKLEHIFIEIKYSGYFNLNWTDDMPQWTEDFFNGFWNLAVSLSSIHDRIRTDDYKSYLGGPQPYQLTLSSSTKILLITALPESGADFPLKNESDYRKILEYLEKAWEKMTRMRSIGKTCDEKLLDIVDKAIDELNWFNKDGYIQIQKLNDALSS